MKSDEFNRRSWPPLTNPVIRIINSFSPPDLINQKIFIGSPFHYPLIHHKTFFRFDQYDFVWIFHSRSYTYFHKPGSSALRHDAEWIHETFSFRAFPSEPNGTRISHGFCHPTLTTTPSPSSPRTIILWSLCLIPGSSGVTNEQPLQASCKHFSLSFIQCRNWRPLRGRDCP